MPPMRRGLLGDLTLCGAPAPLQRQRLLRGGDSAVTAARATAGWHSCPHRTAVWECHCSPSPFRGCHCPYPPNPRLSLSPPLIPRLSLSPPSCRVCRCPQRCPRPSFIPSLSLSPALSPHLSPQQEPEAAVTPAGRGHFQRWQLPGTAGRWHRDRVTARARCHPSGTPECQQHRWGTSRGPGRDSGVGSPPVGHRFSPPGSGATPGSSVPSASLVSPEVALYSSHGPSVPQSRCHHSGTNGPWQCPCIPPGPLCPSPLPVALFRSHCPLPVSPPVPVLLSVDPGTPISRCPYRSIPIPISRSPYPDISVPPPRSPPPLTLRSSRPFKRPAQPLIG